MVWIGLFLGIGVGAATWGLEGALVLGFFGWLIGLVIKSRQAPPKPATPAVGAMPRETLTERVQKLERRVAQLERQLAAPRAVAAAMDPAVAFAPPDLEEPARPAIPLEAPPAPAAAPRVEPPPAPPRAPRRPGPFEGNPA